MREGLSIRPGYLALSLVGLILVLLQLRAEEAAPKAAPPFARLSSTCPKELAFPDSGDLAKDRFHVNHFSLQEFVALNWPAVAGQRGEADPKKRFGDPADSVVWATWKSADELFPLDPEKYPPTSWDDFDLELFPGKGREKDAGRRKLLRQITRLGSILQGGFHATAVEPLVAQNRTYVRYEIRVNKIAYDFIVQGKYYLKENLPSTKNAKPVPFPEGSVIVKAAWMELKDADPKENFYHMRTELDEDAEGPGNQYRPATVGLVGLHVAHKTADRPSWVWSTFEHVDNTEPSREGRRALFSKNDPETVHTKLNVDRPANIPDARQPLPKDPPKPVDVIRANAIHPTTHSLNLRFQNAEEVKGTVWRNYRLVASQWHAGPDGGNPEEFENDKKLRKILPAEGVANTTLETYRQTSSCLDCHRTAADFNFVFFPSIRAVALKKKGKP